jgi:pimeloyl-ACP methyl ester carboxylesterase
MTGEMTDLLAHRVTGNPDGPPVLLLNGGLMTMAAWEPIAAPLGEDYRIVRCDLRGQVLSPGEPEPTLAAHVADLIALLDSLGIERIHAAGTSFGALVAVKLAALHPERTASLTAIAAGERITPEFWERSLRVREAALAAAAGDDGGKVLDLVLPVTYSPEFRETWGELLAAHRKQTALLPALWFLGLARILSSLEGLDLRSDLPRIQCPALVIAGEEDRMFPLERSQALAAGMAGARLEVIPGGSHGLVIERPGQVVEILRSFLDPLTV